MPSDEGTTHRDGDLLVVPNGAGLPRFCVKCGEPAAFSVYKVYIWQPRWLFWTLLLGLGILIGAIVLKFVGSKRPLFVHLCENHLQSYRKRRWMGIWLVLAGILLPVIATVISPENAGWGWMVGIVPLLVGLLAFSTTDFLILTPIFIDRSYALFRGASLSFLQRL
jgi:hypothetical protein